MLVVIGKYGFLASAIGRATKAEEVKVFSSKDLNLLDDHMSIVSDVKGSDAVIDAADYYPGVNATAERPVEVYEKNVRMYENLFEFAALNNIKKVITIGTTGCYPVTDKLLSEKMFNGDPQKLNQKLVSYALSRFTLLDIAALYRSKYDIKHTHLILPNFYGPGDKYEVGRSHLLASWVRDFYNAKKAGKSEIELWGPPIQKREFIYIDDAANYTLALAKLDLKEEVLNVGTATGPTYEEMAKRILSSLDFECTLKWDLGKHFPRQQEVMDLSAMQKYRSKLPKPTLFEKGVGLTVKEFLNVTSRK